MTFTPTADDTPYHRLGEAKVRALSEAFYDAMDAHEPALARLHPLGPDGRVAEGVRARFALFLVEWLGGPAGFSRAHGHPRVRMRHAHVPVDTAMRDAWLRCLTRAMEGCDVPGDVRAYLAVRFAEVADFLRNVAG